MKTTLMGIIIGGLVLIPAFSIPTTADSPTKLITSVYGSFPIPGSESIPNLMHSVIGDILNVGKSPAYNVSCCLSITGGFNSDINKTTWYNSSELPAIRMIAVNLTGASGFGPVTIVLTVSATNANTTTRIAKGFQIGGFTWIPLSWVTPGILQNYIPWLNWHSSQSTLGV
jgi:hypothetical protein